MLMKQFDRIDEDLYVYFFVVFVVDFRGEKLEMFFWEIWIFDRVR